MKAMTDELAALVARQVAALRRQGMPTGQALTLVVQGLPEGQARERLGEVASQLAAGTRPEARDDVLLALLAQGDTAGAEALEEAVKGFELGLQARAAWRRALFLPLALVSGAVALLCLGGWVAQFGELYSSFGTALPAPTVLALDLATLFQWAGPLLLVGLVLAAKKAPAYWMPGVRSLEAAARLRALAAAMNAGLDAAQALRTVGLEGAGSVFASAGLRLDRYERLLGGRLREWKGEAWAASAVAAELEGQGTQASLVFAAWAPVTGVAAFILFVVPLVGSLFLPIFTIAGAIK